jgi:polyhydroxybutyrate depolymerase
VDRARVFSAGFSNGGFLSYRLACELGDRIAAIGPVSGVDGTEGCPATRPVPVLHFHGTADAVVPYAGGGLFGFPGAQASVDGWIARNGCAAGPEESFSNGEVRCASWTACAAGADVTFCTIDGGGHQWPGGEGLPGGGHTTTDIDASEALLTFFEAHPLP